MILDYMKLTYGLMYDQVTEQVLDDRLGRTVTRVVLPRVVMHSRYHYGVSALFVVFGVCDFFFFGGGRGIYYIILEN